MVSEQTRADVDKAKQLYEDRLRTELEAAHDGKFVAIEPESTEYFLGDT